MFLWLFSGIFNKKHTDHVSTDVAHAKIIYRNSKAENKSITINYHSISEAEYKSFARATNPGRISKILVKNGALVEEEQGLALISSHEYYSLIASAKAKLKEIEAKNPSSAELASAQANLTKVQSYAKNSIIRSPFKGRVEKILVDPGENVVSGQELFLVVDYTKLLFKIFVHEKDVKDIKEKEKVQVKTAKGNDMEGVIKFISNSADPKNLTYEVEIEVGNIDNKIPEGGTAEIIIPTKIVQAHKLPLSTIIISDDGQLGVMIYSDADKKAYFKDANIIDQNDEFIWVTGLDDEIKIITLGQGYLKDNVEVMAKSENE